MHSLKFISISFHVFHIMISHMFGMFVFVSYHLGFQYGMGTDMRTVYLISISLHHFRMPEKSEDHQSIGDF